MAGLSAGQTTRVMLAKAFLARPRVALLDEPTASLDPDIAHEVREFVCEAARAGRRFDPLHLAQHGRGRPDLRPRPLPRSRARSPPVGRPDELAASAAATRIRLRVDRGLERPAPPRGRAAG